MLAVTTLNDNLLTVMLAAATLNNNLLTVKLSNSGRYNA